MDKSKPLTLEINKNLWKEFKDRVHRGTSLNDAVVLLIHKFVHEDKYEIDLRNAK